MSTLFIYGNVNDVSTVANRHIFALISALSYVIMQKCDYFAYHKTKRCVFFVTLMPT